MQGTLEVPDHTLDHGYMHGTKAASELGEEGNGKSYIQVHTHGSIKNLANHVPVWVVWMSAINAH